VSQKIFEKPLGTFIAYCVCFTVIMIFIFPLLVFTKKIYDFGDVLVIDWPQ
jgi:hypothetical protein